MLKVKGVNFYPKQVESLLLKHPEIGSDYLIVIDRVGGADRITVKVEAISPTRQDALAGQLSEELYSLLALRAEIDVVAMGELSRPEGKALRVEDKRA